MTSRILVIANNWGPLATAAATLLFLGWVSTAITDMVRPGLVTCRGGFLELGDTSKAVKLFDDRGNPVPCPYRRNP